MSKSEIIKFIILRTIGNFLLLFAVFGVGATFGPAFYYEIQFRTTQARGIRYAVSPEVKPSSPSPEEVKKDKQTGEVSKGFSNVLSEEKVQILIPKDTDFGILIPKLGANQKIYPNIESSSEDEFIPILQKGIAHAKGTVFPGMGGNIYLFAHSTDNFWDVGRYNAVFYLLKDLTAGDDVVVFFENRRYNYKVSELKIVDATDISYLVDSQKGEETLIMQTCWPPGTTWKRLLVFAKPSR